MTILFMGGDKSSMKDTGFADDFTSISYHGPLSFTELGIRSENGDAEYAETPEWTPVQELWLHFVMRYSSTDNPVYFMDGADIAARMRKVSGTTYRLEYLTAPSTYAQVGTDFLLTNETEWMYLDIYLKTGASGEAAVYLNGTERMPLGSASITAAPDIDSIRFYGNNNTNDVGGIVVADEPTIGWRLGRLAPTANGANTAWTGDVTNIDETVLNESDYNYSGTANQVETYTVTTVPSTITGYVPRAVAVSARARRGGSGPQNLQLVLRSGGTDYVSSTQALGLGFEGYEYIWEQNPDTSAAWTSSQLAALQIGIKSIT